MTANDNNNGNKTLIMAAIVATLIIILLCSCSTRKTAKSETTEKEQQTEKITLESETKVIDNTKIVDYSVADELEILPIDNSLPIFVNGIEYKNVRLKQSKKKNNISIAKDVKIQHKAQKDVLKTYKSNKQNTEKETERESFLNYWWLLLLIPVIYFGYRLSKMVYPV